MRHREINVCIVIGLLVLMALSSVGNSPTPTPKLPKVETPKPKTNKSELIVNPHYVD